MIKYVLRPGMVRSKTDGQLHYIGRGPLAELYGVSLSECVTYSRERALGGGFDGLIELSPRADGKYEIPKEVGGG